MSFRLRINLGKESVSIDISFVKQFVVPVCSLVVLIMGGSILLETGGASAGYAYSNSSGVSAASVNGLQRQIAGLEGESQRLKSFAKKMVKLAKLDKEIFNFDNPPARGGLGGRNTLRIPSSETISAASVDLDGIRGQLRAQSNQFERMHLVLKSRELHKSEKRSSWPVTSGYLSSTYGVRKDPFTGRRRKHNGIDLAGPRGSDILSVANGAVIFNGRKGAYGRVVEIQHTNGVISRYAHIEKSLVKKGQLVTAGEIVAYIGSSGRSTGPHLHLEILKNNKNIDPLVFLAKP